MVAPYFVIQHQKFDKVIGSLTRKMSRKNPVDLKKVEKKLGLVPYRGKENNLTMTSGPIQILTEA